MTRGGYTKGGYRQDVVHVDTRENAHVLRREAARRTISERFLAASETTFVDPPLEEPLGFPAHMSLRSVRTGINGGITFTLSVEDSYTDIWPRLVRMAGYPLAVTMEPIDVENGDPFDA